MFEKISGYLCIHTITIAIIDKNFCPLFRHNSRLNLPPIKQYAAGLYVGRITKQIT